MNEIYKIKKLKYLIPMIFLLFGYVFIAWFFIEYLKHNLMSSDVYAYWQDSLNWQTPFHPFHVPGYPLLIALIRGITLDIFPPLALMMVINIISFFGSIYLIYQIINKFTANNELALLGAFLFGLWPFVGLTYTVIPLADIPVIFMFLLGLFLLQQNHPFFSAFFFGIAMIVHKAIWPFIGLFLLSDLISRKDIYSKRNVVLTGVVLFPLITLWLSGALYHNSYTWLLSSNIQVEMASHGSMPVLDGLFGTLVSGSVLGLLKGGLLLCFFLISIFSLWINIKSSNVNNYWGASISISIIILFIILNQHEIWAAVRFSRLLVIPLATGYNWFSSKKIFSWSFDNLFPVVLLLLFISQIAYSWYIARVFFG